MKRLIGILFVFSFLGCTRWVDLYHENKVITPTHELILENISSFVDIPSYHPNMESGDTFLMLEFPGIAFGDDLLSFSNVSGLDLISTPNEIDRAYLFSKLVNQLVEVDNGMQLSGSMLDAYYINKIKNIPPDAITADFLNNFPPSKLNSATYNDAFHLTVVNPSPEIKDSVWTHINKSVKKLIKLKLDKNRSVKTNIAMYDFSASLMVLPIERPWFKYDPLLKAQHIEGASEANRPKYAYIEQLLVAKDLAFKNYGESQSHLIVSTNGKNQKELTTAPSEVIESKHSFIIAYICRLL